MAQFNVPFDRDLFFRKMIRSFAKSLEETVGLDEASGYVALVGSEVGSWLEDEYKRSEGKDSVADDGRGMGESEGRRIGSGSRIVNALAQQIGGTLERHEDRAGTHWSFIFPYRDQARESQRAH